MVISIMLSAGYDISERCSMRPRSFDLVASDGRVMLVIRVVSHIDSVSEEIARDMDQIAQCLGAKPLIVGERARDADLERGAVYLRYGIYALSPATLYDYFVEDIPPLVYASPGGLYVSISGERLRVLRERYNLSLGDLAQRLGVSRRSISKYEGGMGATLDIVIKLEEIFDTPLIESIDLLDYHFRHEPETEPERYDAFSELERMGMELHAMRRAPFHLLVTYREPSREQIILTAYGSAQKILKRAPILGNLSQITKTHAMCVLTDYRKKKKIGSTLIIGEECLHSFKRASELMNLIRDQ